MQHKCKWDILNELGWFGPSHTQCGGWEVIILSLLLLRLIITHLTIATLLLQFQLPIYMYGKRKLIMITLQCGFYNMAFTLATVESWPLYLDLYYNQTLSGHFYLFWPHSNYRRELQLSSMFTKRKRANRNSRSSACFEVCFCCIWSAYPVKNALFVCVSLFFFSSWTHE